MAKDIAGRLREARERAGFDVPDAAKRFGWKRPTVYQHENGTRSPGARALAAYAAAYGVTVEWLRYGAREIVAPLALAATGYVSAGSVFLGALPRSLRKPDLARISIRDAGEVLLSVWGSLEPWASDGDVLIMDRTPAEAAAGVIALAWAEGAPVLGRIEHIEGRWGIAGGPPIDAGAVHRLIAILKAGVM